MLILTVASSRVDWKNFMISSIDSPSSRKDEEADKVVLYTTSNFLNKANAIRNKILGPSATSTSHTLSVVRICEDEEHKHADVGVVLLKTGSNYLLHDKVVP